MQSHKKGAPNYQKGIRNFLNLAKTARSDLTRKMRIQKIDLARENELQGLQKALGRVPEPQNAEKLEISSEIIGLIKKKSEFAGKIWKKFFEKFSFFFEKKPKKK